MSPLKSRRRSPTRSLRTPCSRLPPEHYALSGPAITLALIRRRDALALVARSVLPDAGGAGGPLRHRRRRDRRSSSRRGRPRSRCRSAVREIPPPPSRLPPAFPGRETRRSSGSFSVAGRDSTVVLRGRRDGIRVRVIGGAGEDALSRSPGAGGIRMYDDPIRPPGSAGAIGLDRRPYTPPPKRTPTEIPARDWGHRWQAGHCCQPAPTSASSSAAVGRYTIYGFRKLPFASPAPLPCRVRHRPLDLSRRLPGQFRRENSLARGELLLRGVGDRCAPVPWLRQRAAGHRLPRVLSGHPAAVRAGARAGAATRAAPGFTLGPHGALRLHRRPSEPLPRHPRSLRRRRVR